MTLETEIYQIIGQRLSNKFDSKIMVDWAVSKMLLNYESESLVILAGLDRESTEERAHYFWKSAEELGVDVKEETADISYGEYIAKSVLENKMTAEIGLKEMTKIYRSAKSNNKQKFLHFHEISLELGCMEHIGLPVGVEAKIPFEDLDNFLKKEFTLFLNHLKSGTERVYKENEFFHNWNKLPSLNPGKENPVPRASLFTRIKNGVRTLLNLISKP